MLGEVYSRIRYTQGNPKTKELNCFTPTKKSEDAPSSKGGGGMSAWKGMV